MTATDCRPGRVHKFNHESGWCDHRCGNRNDGRIVTHGGGVVRLGPTEQPKHPALEGFDDYRERMSE
ncbi:hypothetical protein IFU40_05595 [Microbacterium sp. CFBP 13617]|uniref:hypothetical protein n=1 Tax=Microbacterium sp. CFBP 13617 TaxID=2774035 RepID=UPI001780DB28|nr:hypothetical protein [Microbacterium sp. CFBP 13617]MBD8218110.1 hypothetical protein [Microbacterium sp. CFBP 13617]